MTQELTTTNQQLATRPDPFAVTTFEQVKEMAAILAEANMYGLKQPAQFISLMMMANEEHITLGRLMQRVHVFPDGKLSNRSDWLQAEFEEKAGKIIFHIRTDDLCVATFIRGQDVTDEQRDRAEKRFELLMQLEADTWTNPRDVDKERKLQVAIGKLAREGEETVLRSAADAEEKGIAMDKTGNARKTNWHTSPRAMLQWRCVSEGVKVICPRILSGMPTDIEYNDVRVIEDRHRQRITTATTISQDDVPAILEIIAQHDAELATDIPDSRRKTVQGLRMDLVCKLADIGVKPPAEPEAPKPTVAGVEAKTVDAVVLPPEKTEATTKQPAARQQRPKPQPAAAPADDLDMTPTAATQGMDTPWREFICLRGQSPGMMHGHTLESIFLNSNPKLKPDTAPKLDKLVGWFTSQAIHTSSDAHDKILWAKVQEADNELRAGFAEGTTAAPASTQTTTAAEKPAQQASVITGWREFIIPGKHPDFSGKTLESIGAAGVKQLHDEYLPQIDWAKATIQQRSLKANVALAMAELHPAAKAAADAATDGPDDHTKALVGLVATYGWEPAFFLTTCKINGWIAEARRKVEEITAAEYATLEDAWPKVEEEMAKTEKQP